MSLKKNLKTNQLITQGWSVVYFYTKESIKFMRNVLKKQF